MHRLEAVIWQAVIRKVRHTVTVTVIGYLVVEILPQADRSNGRGSGWFRGDNTVRVTASTVLYSHTVVQYSLSQYSECTQWSFCSEHCFVQPLWLRGSTTAIDEPIKSSIPTSYVKFTVHRLKYPVRADSHCTGP